jgi:hypothetical protein
MERRLFSCRDAEPVMVSDHFGLIGDTYCPLEQGGCYTPAHRPQLLQVYTAVEGLEFPDLPYKIPIPPLPEAVATIPGDSPLPFRLGPLGPAVATRYTQIGGLRSNPIRAEKVAGWRNRRNVGAHKRLILLQESGDTALESLFPATLRPEFFPAIAKLRDVVLVSPGYSVYDDGTMCEWLQLLNLKRSIFFVYLANLAGLPCIPCIGWHKDRLRDLQRLAAWLTRQGDKVTHLAANAQTGGDTLWAALAEGMTYLEEATGRTYHWMMCGGTDPLHVIYRRFPVGRMTHVSAAVPTYTLKHRLLGQKATNDLKPDELLRQNLERQEWRRAVAAMMPGQAAKEIRMVR